MKKNIFELCNRQIKDMSEYIMFRIKAKQIELTPQLKAKNRAPIALSMGAPVEKVPEFIIEKIKKYIDFDSLHTYSTPKGEMRLLEAIQKHMQERFTVNLNPKNEIFSLIGSKEGLSNLIKALVNPNENDVILVPIPGYASYYQMINVAGGVAYGIQLNEENNYMPDMNKILENYIKEGNDPTKIKALIVNYPNNPLGCTCTKEYLQHCVDFCNKNDIILISDNAYCDMYYDEEFKPHSVLECEGAMDCSIEMYSFSKSYAMTGWRMGWACGNKDIITILSRQKSTIDTGIFKVLQYAGADLLESQEGKEYIKNQNKKFKSKIEKFVTDLNSLGYEVKMPKAAFYLWVKIPDRFSHCEEFTKQLLEKSGIVVVPGTAYDLNATRYIRVSVVASDEDLAEIIKRMKEDGFQFQA